MYRPCPGAECCSARIGTRIHACPPLQAPGRVSMGLRRYRQPRYHVLTDFPEDRLVLETVPLSAVYLLSPARPDGNAPAAQRDLLPPITATVALVRQPKGGCLLGKSESAVVLDRAADLARTVSVYRLRVVRDFDRLDDVVEQLFAWHGRPASQSALAGV